MTVTVCVSFFCLYSVTVTVRIDSQMTLMTYKYVEPNYTVYVSAFYFL